VRTASIGTTGAGERTLAPLPLAAETGGTLYSMAKRQEWNLPAMSEAELRAHVARCNRRSS
jgi:hypothetical protein